MTTEKPSKKTKLTLWVPEDVVERAKIQAIRDKRPVSEIVTELLNEWLRQGGSQQCHA